MAINYTGQTIGKMWIEQDGRTFKIQLRESNCLVCAIHPFQKLNSETNKKEWYHELVNFFADESHLKKCTENQKIQDYFYGDIKKVRLNLYYKDNRIFLKYLVEDGIEVTCYYEEPKQK
jgi:hypothetical protein